MRSRAAGGISLQLPVIVDALHLTVAAHADQSACALKGERIRCKGRISLILRARPLAGARFRFDHAVRHEAPQLRLVLRHVTNYQLGIGGPSAVSDAESRRISSARLREQLDDVLAQWR